MSRRQLAGNGVVVGLGLAVGALSAIESFAPLVAIVGLAFVVASLRSRSLPVAIVFFGILMAARGLTGLHVLGLPLTLSKVAVVFALGAHLVQTALSRRPLVALMPVSVGMGLVLITMLLSLTTSLNPSEGYEQIASIMMLVVMAHLVHTMLPDEAVPGMLRFMAVTMAVVMLWTLLTQRAQAFFFTLDHAWQQRTSGAYGDPNYWATCVLLCCPPLLAFLARDDHWSSTPLLVAIGALFPLAILQSLSRAALLVFVLLTPGLFVLVRHRRSLLVWAGGAALLLLPFVLNLDSALLRYQTLVDPTLEADLGHGSFRERRALLKAALQIFAEYPLLGVGVGMFRTHAAYVTAGDIWKVAHNAYVNVAAEQGIVGLAGHGFFLLQVVRSALEGWHSARTVKGRSLALGFLLSGASFAMMAFTLNLAAFAMAWYMLALGLCVDRWVRRQEAADEASGSGEEAVMARELVA